MVKHLRQYSNDTATTIICEMTHAAEYPHFRPEGKWLLCAKYLGNSYMLMYCPCACTWMWYQHMCTTAGIIKGSNYRQTNELCILFSQTNEWADFDGTQKRRRNVWKVQAIAWETDVTFLKWSVDLNNMMLPFRNIISGLFLIKRTMFCI